MGVVKGYFIIVYIILVNYLGLEVQVWNLSCWVSMKYGEVSIEIIEYVVYTFCIFW